MPGLNRRLTLLPQPEVSPENPYAGALRVVILFAIVGLWAFVMLLILTST